MIHNKTVCAILLLAGQSVRMGIGHNKVIATLGQKPVFMFSLCLLDAHPAVDEILLAVNPSEQDIICRYLQQANLTTPITFVTGGSTRQASVHNALEMADADYILIHDGARPFIKPSYIDDCLKTLKTHKGVSVGVPVKDTIKLTNEYGEVISTTHRPTTWITQTPQAFHADILLNLHRKAGTDFLVTDDCSLLEHAGFDVKMVRGDYTNLKLTTLEDLAIMQLMVDLISKQEPQDINQAL